METVVTSTALTENQSNTLEFILKEKFTNVKYCPDLTSEVRILVVNKNDPLKHWLKSKKFKYVTAYRPDVRVIDFEDICYTRSNNDNDNDRMGDSFVIMKIPQLKPFENLQISLCRLEDGLLGKIQKLIESNGGKVTHHLTNETDIMVSMVAEGKRYDAALKWGIPVLSPDWCYDSVDRGLPLATKYYQLMKNMTGVVKKLNFEGEEDRTGNETIVKTYKLGRRDEACDWQKLKAWRDSEESRKLEDYIKQKIDKENKLKRGEIEAVDEDEDGNTTLGLDDSTLVSKKRSLIKGDDDDDKIVKIRKVTKSDEFWNSFMQKDKKQMHKVTSGLTFFKKQKPKNNGPVLQGLKFRTVGYNLVENEKLCKVIANFGGRVVSGDGKVDFTVVSFKYDKPIKGENFITELAIERFIYNEKVDAGDYLWCKPFAISATTSVSDFRGKLFSFNQKNDTNEKIKISITGFEGTDLSQMERLLKEKLSQWVEFRPVFNKECELLVFGMSGHTNTGRLRKQQLAKRWSVPVLLVEDFFSKVLELSL